MRLGAAIALNLLCSTVADVLAKFWGQTGDARLFWIGMAVNVGTTAFFMTAIRLGGLAGTTAFVLLATVALNVGIGVLAFRERLAPEQWAGLALAAVAISLLARR